MRRRVAHMSVLRPRACYTHRLQLWLRAKRESVVLFHTASIPNYSTSRRGILRLSYLKIYTRRTSTCRIFFKQSHKSLVATNFLLAAGFSTKRAKTKFSRLQVGLQICEQLLLTAENNFILHSLNLQTLTQPFFKLLF